MFSGSLSGAACYFVAGTDTEVGKTFCSAALLHVAAAAGKKSCGFKPVASEADGNGHNADVLALQQASAVKLAYGQHNLYTFAEATAPHLAARDEGCQIETAHLSAGLRRLQAEAGWVLVEGAGGWHTPLNDTVCFSEWVGSEGLPVILVVGMKLGCINHALLTAEAVRAAGLPLAGWVANCLSPVPHRLDDYVAELQQRLGAPLLGVVPYLPDGDVRQAMAYLSIESLGR